MKQLLLPVLALSLALVSSFASEQVARPRTARLEVPRALDDRLEVSLFAAAPDIVQPVGCAFDSKGRLLVIESHTHFRPKDYKGPEHDRIRIIEDSDGDGKADRFTTYFEGTTATMDIAVHPDGSVYLATRNEIIRLTDSKGTGKATSKERIVFLDTKGNYPHNGLSGLCFDSRGDLYFGMGENLGENFKLIGSDGTIISGGGEGGNIVWCTAAGKKLRRVATGLWNPFGICRDKFGRVFAVDNDPDSSPPCRLLHVVEGADFGFQFRYGRSGRHPFQSWNGQLPGTLPMVSGTGESPCEVISYQSDGLPADYRGDLLVAAWADHRLERYTLKPNGASFKSQAKPFVLGGKDFHPVGIAVAPDGALFVSDWGSKDYNLHGKGAIWQVRAKVAKKTLGPPARDDADVLGVEIVDRMTAGQFAVEVRQLLNSTDPYVRHAAVQRLAKTPDVLGALDMKEAGTQIRLGLLLAHRASVGAERTNQIPIFLRDKEEEVRLLAVKWIADELLSEYRASIEAAMKDKVVNVRMYLAYATALARIDGNDVNEGTLAKRMLAYASGMDNPETQRVLALQLVPANHVGLSLDVLRKLLESKGIGVQRETVRTLCEHPSPMRFDLLRDLLKNEHLDENLRAQALLGLAEKAPEMVDSLLGLTEGKSDVLADEALRALVHTHLSSSQKDRLAKLATQRFRMKWPVARILDQPVAKDRPAVGNLDSWLARLEGPSDPEAGRRVFFHPRLGACFRCHRVEGRGQDIGPDLSTVGQSERQRILESLLRPSAQVAPQYQTWLIETVDGKVRTGLLVRTYLDESTYQDEKGALFTVNTSSIAETRPLSRSIMPEGLAEMMTDQELRDLLAYLCARR